jgi:hypothetical protein
LEALLEFFRGSAVPDLEGVDLMADDYLKARRLFESEDRSGLVFREILTPNREGPLRARPSSKGGPSINQTPVPPVVISVWSASDAAANDMVLSNDGLTVAPSGVVGNQAIRGTVSHNTGKWYVEFLNSAAVTSSAMMFGLADSSFNAVNNYLGSNGISCGSACAGPFYGTPGFSGFTRGATTPAIDDVWAIAIDFGAGLAWLAQNNAWITGSNPSSGTNPLITIASPALGVALFPGMTFYGPGNGVWTLQPIAASQKYAPPTGFSPWK